MSWVPLCVGTWLAGNLNNGIPRESFLLDYACWAQFWGFIPLSLIAEGFIGDKMRQSLPHLEQLVRRRNLKRLAERANRRARSWIADTVCVALAFFFTALWAIDEVSNGLPSWHTSTRGVEHFTFAAWWATLVALPLFTFLWLRWVWKIVVWTRFLFELSRNRLKLMATHPNRTGGLGALSDVQTSFAIVIFGTGILFSVAICYKVFLEGTSLLNYTVWLPVVGYIILAPGVFLAPLFLFTPRSGSGQTPDLADG